MLRVSLDTSMEEIKPVVTDIQKFENWNDSLLIPLFGKSDNQDFDAYINESKQKKHFTQINL